MAKMCNQISILCLKKGVGKWQSIQQKKGALCDLETELANNKKFLEFVAEEE